MKRREFITLLGGAAAAWPLAARAQQPAMPVIGFLGSASREPNAPMGGDAFRNGLRKAAMPRTQRGDRISLGGNQYDRLPAMAAELVRRQVAVLVAAGGTCDSPLRPRPRPRQYQSYSRRSDPVKLGLVASLNRPGGNVTGIKRSHRRVGCEADGNAAGIGADGARDRCTRQPDPSELRGSVARRTGSGARARAGKYAS